MITIVKRFSKSVDLFDTATDLACFHVHPFDPTVVIALSVLGRAMTNPAASGSRFRFVKYLWSDEEAEKLDGVDRLVYRSNRLGDDLTLTNTGGGNTSSKLREKDPLTGEEVEVLWVKGSGGDLRTAGREFFSSLYQDKLIGLQRSYGSRPDKGLKAQAEDDMVGAYSHCTFNLNPRASSID